MELFNEELIWDSLELFNGEKVWDSLNSSRKKRYEILRIDGPNIFPALNNQLQLLNELNLKEGQKIIGKIINLFNNDAMLEIAGRPLQAKIEGTLLDGNPLLVGTTQTFLVNTDDQSRIVLKIISNTPENTEIVNNSTGSTNDTTPFVGKSAVPGFNNASLDQQQKVVAAALNKEGLSPTNENVSKVMRYLQDFQIKYKQPLDPQVVTFIMSKKWPVTPGTILASLVFQDQGVRNLLLNTFQNALPDKAATSVFTKYLLNMNSESPEIQEKLQNSVDFKMQDLLEKLSDLMQQAKTNPQPKTNPTQLSEKSFIINEIKTLLQSSGKNLTAEDPKPKSKEQTPTIPEKTQFLGNAGLNGKQQLPLTTKIPSINQAKLETIAMKTKSDPELTDSEEKSVGLPVKVQTVLDQNIALNKAILKETAVNGSSNLIPLLVNDSQTNIRECMIKWQEEKNETNNGKADQVVYMNIPTENMGDIHLALRVGANGTKINFRVFSEEIRKYLLQHTNELKQSLPQDNPIIAVNLNEKDLSNTEIYGVDIWM